MPILYQRSSGVARWKGSDLSCPSALKVESGGKQQAKLRFHKPAVASSDLDCLLGSGCQFFGGYTGCGRISHAAAFSLAPFDWNSSATRRSSRNRFGMRNRNKEKYIALGIESRVPGGRLGYALSVALA